MKIPRIKSTVRPRQRVRNKLFGAIIIFLLIFIGAGLLSRQSNDHRSRATPPIMATSESSNIADTFGGSPRSDENLNKLGMEKIAEMTALVRHSEICAEVPQEWSAAFIVLMATATPTEEQVEAQERKMLALRDKIGDTKWCQLYSVEMQEAYVIYQFTTHR